jgi:heptosyltransferase-1
MNAPLRILLVRVSSLGDVVHNMPVVADIHRHHPDAQIDWVVEENYAGLVRLNQGVRKVIPFALRRWRKRLFARETRAEIRAFRAALRAESYDWVFDTQGLLKTGIIMGMARGGKKVGLANGSVGSGYEGVSRVFHDLSIPTPPRTHAVERGRIVVSQALGFPLDAPADFGLRGASLEQAPGWLPRQPYACFCTPPRATPRNGRRRTGSRSAASCWSAASWCCCHGAPRPKSAMRKRSPRRCRTRACCRR